MPRVISIETLFEDAELLVVAKPAGMTVIPAREGPPEDALVHRLQSARGERLWVVHRIDRDTSGVLVLARTAAAHRALSLAFEHRQVHKQYETCTRGLPVPLGGSVEVPLHPARKGRMRPARPDEPGALPSRTDYATLISAQTDQGPVAWLRASPHTGRQHQIRVHLRTVEAPLLVDPFYGKCEGLPVGALGPGSPALKRLALHAQRIELPHPRTGQMLTVEASLPDDMAQLKAWLVGQATPVPCSPQ